MKYPNEQQNLKVTGQARWIGLYRYGIWQDAHEMLCSHVYCVVIKALSPRVTIYCRTDQDALRGELSLTDMTWKLVQWQVRLFEVNFEIVQRAGAKHQAMDALSACHDWSRQIPSWRWRTHTDDCQRVARRPKLQTDSKIGIAYARTTGLTK